MSLVLRTNCRPLFLAAGLLLAPLLAIQFGCSRAADERSAVIEQCAEATLAKQSPLPALRDAIAKIEQQGGLPSQLKQAPLPEDRNAAAALARVLDGPLRTALSKPLEDFTNRDRFAFDPEELAGIARLIERHAERVERIREAAAAPAARFPIAPELGYFSRVDYLDDAAIACRFDLASAAEAIEYPSIDKALTAMERAARWIGWLAHEPRLEPRLLAARLRGEWLRAVEAVVAHPSATLSDYGRLRLVLVGWLADWPAPVAALHGDRAASIHAYEAIRHGLLKQVLTVGEWSRLAKHGVTSDNPPTGEALDRDQAAYLAAMQRAATLVSQPYYQRFQQHANVEELLSAVANTSVEAGAPHPAPLAAEMFLPGLPSALEAMAIDRASCEAWTLALSAAGGFNLPEHRINPHNGEPYRVERMPRSLVVNTGDAAIRDPFALRRNQ